MHSAAIGPQTNTCHGFHGFHQIGTKSVEFAQFAADPFGLCVRKILFVLILVLSFWTELKAEPVRLAWNPSFDSYVAGYNLYRSDMPAGPYTRLNKSLIQSPFYTDNSAETNRTYYYTVTTVHLAGAESGNSSELMVVTGKRPPVVEAGPELVAKSGQTVILSGNAWDPEGRPLVYSWSQVSGSNVAIIRADKSEATFLAPVVSQDNYLSFRLTVTNSEGATATDSVQVTVRR